MFAIVANTVRHCLTCLFRSEPTPPASPPSPFTIFATPISLPTIAEEIWQHLPVDGKIRLRAPNSIDHLSQVCAEGVYVYGIIRIDRMDRPNKRLVWIGHWGYYFYTWEEADYYCGRFPLIHIPQGWIIRNEEETIEWWVRRCSKELKEF